MPTNCYSPVRHLATAAFPFSDKKRYMLMLSAYMDETGHSRDEKQRFNGMAGLVAPADRWQILERQWKRTLRRFQIPYFHMKDFANFQGHFEGWTELKRRKLFDKLLTHIGAIRPFPLGSILSMEDFRSLTEEQRDLLGEPYYIGFHMSVASITFILDRMMLDQKAALVFSDQVEFRHQALRFYEDVYKGDVRVRRRTDPPVFRDMREMVPLQAADIVAYEMYKEYERLIYRPQVEPRHGYKALVQMTERLGFREPYFAFMLKQDLVAGCERMKQTRRILEYWNKKKGI